MISSKFRFTLDLHSTQSQVAIPVTKNDTARVWYISLSDGGLPYVIEDGCTARMEIKRPTGTHLFAWCAIENNTTIKYDFSQNTYTAIQEGIHECLVSIYDADGYMIASPRFSMIVNDRIIDSDNINISDDQRTEIERMINAEISRQQNEISRINAEAERVERQAALNNAIEEIKRGNILANNATNAINATYATYATYASEDASKGTIEGRLGNALYIVSFDSSTGTLVTKSADHEEA